MIDLYTWPTPNGHKLHIMLEETGLAYNVVPVDIGEGEQFTAEFLRISPNNKMPAMVDHEGPDGEPLALAESGAMLIYLGEKTGRFYPSRARERHAVNQWLMTQMGHVGPMLGQLHHFRNYALEKLRYAIDRYANEGRRLYGVLDRRLGEAEWLAGGEYTIADIATFPWIRIHENQGIGLGEFPNVERWVNAVAARPAVERGMLVLAERRRAGPMDEKTREMLFGPAQYDRR